MTSTDLETSAPRNDAAERPQHFGVASLWQVALRVGMRAGRDRIGLVAAGIAFYALLAIFPGTAALVAVAGLIVDPDIVVTQLEEATAQIPASAREILLGQVREVAGADAMNLNLAALAGLAVTFYSASRGVANLIAGLNVAYEEDEARSFLRLLGLTLLLTFLLILTMTVAIAVVAVIPAVLSVFGDWPIMATLAEIARWPILLLVGAAVFTLLYRYGPSRRAARWRWLAPGGALACLLWIAGTIAFAWYVQTLGTYTETFGALAGVIVLLLWLWLSAFCVLLGAVLDAELEHQTRHDSTVGPDKPMGQRGAVKADTYAAKPDNGGEA